MLLDSGHRRWLVGTVLVALAVVGFYATLSTFTPGGLTGGSTVGLWYGVGGSLLMVYAGLLAAHRRLARLPWLPRRSWMLKGHIWLGLLSVVVILCHSGFRWGGPLERILWVVLGLTVLSGVVGLALQQFLPRLLTLQVTEETPYEQMPHVARQLLVRADALVDQLCGSVPSAPQPDLAAGQTALGLVRKRYDGLIRPFLQGAGNGSAVLLNPEAAEQEFAGLRSMPDLAGAREKLDQLEELCRRRRQLVQQERLHHWLHGWLLAHVPLSVALLVLGLAHAIMSLYY